MLFSKVKVSIIRERSLMSKNFLSLLELQNISIPELSIKIDLPTSTLYNLLNKGEDLKITTAKKISDFFCVSVHEFCTCSTLINNKRSFISENFLTNISININKLLLKNNINYNTFSLISGISSQTIREILSKKTHDCKISTLLKFAEFFNTTIDNLLSNELVVKKMSENIISSKPFLDEGNLKYIPIIEFSILSRFLNWKTINSTINISKLIMVSPTLSQKGKLFGLYAPFFTPYFNKNSILIISTNLNNENKMLNLFIGYSKQNNSYYILKKEKAEFFAYLEENNSSDFILELELIAAIISIILEAKK